ncbi:NAD(P)/FAD-dependent oxidoreductase [Leptolyngbyaceae cyanobacterium CCMR0082]|uniref:demethylphylloquinone reductase n=2 Tax=Adonisia turfae TaxID=2950184 RepID=A0A6M0S672_9CYAN|nr:NAD(P)/FAD-dependent oxidoreductase [Adonisia turfae]MDV3350480.1 NAD(P)/FAD-dependent oxidoreductase [Leptothoe sp. LEGE 181152]NEZ55687.1 NAD(P)/FAD-dependent oxidoreductase [Adonisia turfae CCMR0081]NEZ63332.1 NAD(P)/FAD-dependent oxidoreductase [Adonisia turfae CCMR0082]
MAVSNQRVVILGGGFGGLYTALALSKLPWDKAIKPEITLVDQRDRFLFAPLLYELVTDELQTWEIAPPYAELLAGTGIKFHQSGVSGIDAVANSVCLQDDAVLPYDYLVLALGGETPMDMAPGVKEYAIAFRTLSDAYALKERLRELEASDADQIRVAVVGGGYSGVELVCKLAERLGERGRLRIVERGTAILQNSPEFNQKAAQDALTDKGIWIDYETTVTEIDVDTISLKYKDQVDVLPVDLVLWTVGNQVNPLIASLPFDKNEHQQLKIQPTLQLLNQGHIFALGDLADGQDADGNKVPTTAQAALQQADYTAWNIWAALTGRPPLPFRYQHLGEMMTLGSDTATLTGLGLKLDGTAAHIVRRLTYLYRMPTFEHQLRVGLNWISQPLRELLSAS